MNVPGTISQYPRNPMGADYVPETEEGRALLARWAQEREQTMRFDETRYGLTALVGLDNKDGLMAAMRYVLTGSYAK